MTKKHTDIHKMIIESKKIAEATQEQLELHLDRAVSASERRRLAVGPRAKTLKRASQAAQLTVAHLGKLLED